MRENKKMDELKDNSKRKAKKGVEEVEIEITEKDKGKSKGKDDKKLTEENSIDKELNTLSLKLGELQEKNADYEEMVKRQQAEFDNYRKRSIEERNQLLRYAPENFLKDFLTIYDHFEKAVEVETENEELRNYVEGFLLIKNQIEKMLEKHGVKESTRVGDEFNPNLHHAIQTEDEGGSEERVKEVYQKGYFLYEKVIRETVVKISKTDEFASASVDSNEEGKKQKEQKNNSDIQDNLEEK